MDAKVAVVVDELGTQLRSIYRDRLVRLVLFGSQARGDADPDSDIDVLIVLQGKVKPGEEILRTGETISTLSLKHNVVISRTFVSKEGFLAEQSSLLLNVRSEGVSV